MWAFRNGWTKKIQEYIFLYKSTDTHLSSGKDTLDNHHDILRPARKMPAPL